MKNTPDKPVLQRKNFVLEKFSYSLEIEIIWKRIFFFFFFFL